MGLVTAKMIWLCIVSMYILYLAKCPIFGGLPLLPFRKVTQQLHFSPGDRRTWASRYQRLEAEKPAFSGEWWHPSVIREVVCEGQGSLPLRRLAMKSWMNICWICDWVPPKCKKIPSVELSAYSVSWSFDCNGLKFRKFQVEDSSKTKIPGSFVKNTPGPSWTQMPWGRYRLLAVQWTQRSLLVPC